ncbi:MAG: hypothetical protein JOZ81_30630 [Chloroflexi bacterium]|nr:hypothetical protein [Chloroflexota bacterium]MBV9543008.1 hypothetical protein [Chloroflexota bacterium]
MLWSARDHAGAGDYAERALAAAHGLNDTSCIARSLDRVGNWHLSTGPVRQALTYQQQALGVLESAGDARGGRDAEFVGHDQRIRRPGAESRFSFGSDVRSQ